MEQLSPQERIYYSRQLLRPGFTADHQLALKNARVLCIGVGGLGCPFLHYINAAGIGRIGMMDGDQVEEHNLHRQTLFGYADIGKNKAEEAKEKLKAANPYTTLLAFPEHANADNLEEMIPQYDMVVDATDNFKARYLIHDACYKNKKVLLSGSVLAEQGQIFLLDPAKSSACYRCLFPKPPGLGEVPNCQEAGVLGAHTGIIGSYMANFCIKDRSDQSMELSHKLFIIDTQTLRSKSLHIVPDKRCPLCGTETVQLSPQTKSGVEELSHKNFLIKLRSTQGALLIDVRTKPEYLSGHLRDAIHIPAQNMEEITQTYQAHEDILLYCKSGMRSRYVGDWLMEQGYTRVSHLSKGIEPLSPKELAASISF